jgi:hypothetical protein
MGDVKDATKIDIRTLDANSCGGAVLRSLWSQSGY